MTILFSSSVFLNTRFQQQLATYKLYYTNATIVL